MKSSSGGQGERDGSARAYGYVAETLLADSLFRAVDNEGYSNQSYDLLDTAEVELRREMREAAKQIVFETYVEYGKRPEPELRWEMNRRAVLAQLGGVALGHYDRYFSSFQSEAPSSDESVDSLPAGEPRVIETNSRIISAKKIYDDPVQFFRASLGVIESRRHFDRRYVGPENYATALKFFSSKYLELEQPSMIPEVDIKDLVSECLDGFVDVVQRDEPNFVEMTNIYSSIRVLPQGTIDPRFTKPIIELSLRTLPSYSDEVISTMLASLPKLDLSEHGNEAAQLTNLALRKSKKFEKTHDLRSALRALTVLPDTLASRRALQAFFEHRNDLEKSLDIIGAEEVLDRLRILSTTYHEDPAIVEELKFMGESTARSISLLSKRAILEGGLSKDQEILLREAFERMMHNYLAI